MKKFLIVLCLIGGMFCRVGYAQFMKEALPEGNYVSASDIAKEKRKKEQKEVMEDENVSVENDEKNKGYERVNICFVSSRCSHVLRWLQR